MLRIAFAGSRAMRDWEWMIRLILPVHREFPNALLVHGAQVTTDPDTGERYGADYLADRIWLAAGGSVPERHPADWDQHGRAAGPIRNEQIAALGAHLLIAVLIDGLPCKGTRDMINRAETHSIPVKRRIYRPRPVPQARRRGRGTGDRNEGGK